VVTAGTTGAMIVGTTARTGAASAEPCGSALRPIPEPT